jgi:hypothetical protein
MVDRQRPLRRERRHAAPDVRPAADTRSQTPMQPLSRFDHRHRVVVPGDVDDVGARVDPHPARAIADAHEANLPVSRTPPSTG